MKEVAKGLLIIMGVVIIAMAGLQGLYKVAGSDHIKRTCPQREGEKLAYSTYHSNGRLECTYIRNTTGEAKRKI